MSNSKLPTTQVDIAALWQAEHSSPSSPSPAELPSPSSPKPKKEKSFLARQYSLMTTPYFRIYLQGVLPVDYLSPEEVSAFFSVARIVPIGRRDLPATSTGAIAIRKFIEEEEWKTFFSSPATHRAALLPLVEARLSFQAPAVLNKTKASFAIFQYLEHLEAFLVEQGYPSAETYLSDKAQAKGPTLSLQDLKAGLEFL